jgi:hypothetical protein
MDDREEQAADKDLICAASFLWHTQQFKKAGQVVSKVIEANPSSLSAITLKGWIYLSAPKDEVQ